MKEILYGVIAASLDEANDQVQRALNIQTVGGDGLHNGGEYYHFELPTFSLQLRENIDLDDQDMEHGGLHEPEHAAFKWLLYFWGSPVPNDIQITMAKKPEIMRLLREK